LVGELEAGRGLFEILCDLAFSGYPPVIPGLRTATDVVDASIFLEAHGAVAAFNQARITHGDVGKIVRHEPPPNHKEER